MNTPILASMVFGIIAALRRASPKIDGRAVWLATFLLAAVVAFLFSRIVEGWQVIAQRAFSAALGAFAIDGAGSRIAEHVGAARGTALPVAGELLSTTSSPPPPTSPGSAS